jgi:hypothetical protein
LLISIFVSSSGIVTSCQNIIVPVERKGSECTVWFVERRQQRIRKVAMAKVNQWIRKLGRQRARQARGDMTFTFTCLTPVPVMS